MTGLITSQIIEQRIFVIRGQNVMLDRDLAKLYNVPTKVLNQAVKRNSERFPPDFMFRLNSEEFKDWRSHFVTSKSDKIGLRYPPYAFTEHGILMLSSVLNSPRAIAVNIAIMRIFVRLRRLILTHKGLEIRLQKLEQTVGKQERHIQTIFEIIQKLTAVEEKPKRQIGFHAQE